MNSERAGTHCRPFPWFQLLFAVLFLGMVAVGLYLGYIAYHRLREFAAYTQFRSIPVIPAPITDQQQQLTSEASVERSSSLQQPAVDAPPRSEIYPNIENEDRVNILFLGIDQRPGESTACRTDTMILVSVNPKDMSASILSIPRDLWVPIRLPSHPEGKINTAHYWGEVEDYPGGGPALAKHTVRYNFGVPVHYYVRLNFTGFEQIIDTIGGIDIDVPETIDDPKYPNGSLGYEHLHIEAGRQHFDGEMALKYARTRHGAGDGDFSRMDRQQQVVLAVRDKVLSLPNLPQLVLQLPQLARNLGDSLDTDIPPDMMFQLARWAQQIKVENIRHEVIDRRVTTDRRAADGQAVLVYDREKARPIIEALFGDPTPEAQATQVSQIEKLEAEGARVAVYNGTGITGLAGKIAPFLTKQGIDVVRTDNADHFDYERTVITVYGEKPFTVEWLTHWLASMGASEPDILSQPGSDKIDVAIVIGKDLDVSQLQ